MRRFWLVTHRWVGIVTMPVVVIVGLTGSYLVWFGSKPMVRIHAKLGLGQFGGVLVNVVTLATTFLLIGGLVLWWRRKIWTINRKKGWWRLLFDLHHVLGILGAGLMLVISLSGTGLMLTEEISSRSGLDRKDPRYPTRTERRLRNLAHWSHTARPFKGTFGVFWVICSAAFAVQAVTGVVMWWKPPKDAT